MKRSDHWARCSLSSGDRISKKSLAVEIVTRPIGWGCGAVAASAVGLISLDLISAFVLGFIVGIVHDLALYYLRIIGFSSRIRAIRFEDRFARASRTFADGNWRNALPLLENLHRSWPGHKGALYLLIRCYDKARDSIQLRVACREYMMMRPRQDEILEIREMLGRVQVPTLPVSDHASRDDSTTA